MPLSKSELPSLCSRFKSHCRFLYFILFYFITYHFELNSFIPDSATEKVEEMNDRES